MFSPALSENPKGQTMIYIRAPQLSGFALSVSISHISHDRADLSKFNPLQKQISSRRRRQNTPFTRWKAQFNKSFASWPARALSQMQSEKTSPGRERGVFRGGFPSPCKDTDMAPVINLLSFYCAALSFLSLPPLPHTESSSFLPVKPQPIHMPGRPDSFICQAVLLTQWIAGPSLCYADQTGLPRGQTSASHSGPG